MNGSVFYSAIAGFCGAVAATSGKFGFRAETEFMTMLSLFLFIISNFIMWVTYTRSLSLSKTTSTPMIINMAFNFGTTGILGFIFFQESHSVIWWIMLSLLIVGLTIILSTSSNENMKNKK